MTAGEKIGNIAKAKKYRLGRLPLKRKYHTIHFILLFLAKVIGLIIMPS